MNSKRCVTYAKVSTPGGAERRGAGGDLHGRRRGAGDAAGRRGGAGAAGAQPQGRHRAQQGHAGQSRARRSRDGLLATNSGGAKLAARSCPRLPRPHGRRSVTLPHSSTIDLTRLLLIFDFTR